MNIPVILKLKHQLSLGAKKKKKGFVGRVCVKFSAQELTPGHKPFET